MYNINTNYSIQQFEDKSLSHYAYAILINNEIILIDPARNPQPYYDFATKHHAKIVGVIETHPHADFVSSHLEIHQTTGATIYVSKLVKALYKHCSFDEGDKIQLSNITLHALNTPGHSPDSICVILKNDSKNEVVFTGDTLFIDDCGRPDLRENAGNITASRQTLAKSMYYTLRQKLLNLENAVLVYPAHGAGSLCGKALSSANSSTIGAQRISNWSLQNMPETEFVHQLLASQPFIPPYFSFNVTLNRLGATNFLKSIKNVTLGGDLNTPNHAIALAPEITIIDTRPQTIYKQAHLPNSINLMIGLKFETWLGTLISPNQFFYLCAQNQDQLSVLIQRIAKIGYETQIKAAFLLNFGNQTSDSFNLQQFKQQPNNYTIIDIRNQAEVSEKPIFNHSINIPLAELRSRINEIPITKPIVVHCAGGYRSAAGSSLIKSALPNTLVYDFGEDITRM